MSQNFDRVPCPICGAVFDLEQAWDDVDGRRFVQLLTQLPPTIIRPFYNYLKLFKPASQSLRWNRVLKLAQELAPQIKAAQIKRNGIVYAAPAERWAQVMDELVRNRPKSLSLPLKNHGYLLQILANQGEKQLADIEKKTEKKRQNRTQTRRDTGMQPIAARLEKTKRKAPPTDWRPKTLGKKTTTND